jgi:transcriptional regulator with XRE-family HTH domain
MLNSKNYTKGYPTNAVNQMTNQFGERIRQLREKQELFLRQVAPSLDMDTAQLSKIEKGIRQIKKEQIDILAEVLVRYGWQIKFQILLRESRWLTRF